MATKPNPAEPADPYELQAWEFRRFARFTPTYFLKANKIERPSFYAVCMALAEFGTFKTGEDVRPTQVALADITGLSTATVRKVLAFLERAQAVEVVDLQRHGGSPSKVYRFRRSKFVADVMRTEDRDWKPDESASRNHRPTQAERVGTTAPLSRNHSTTECEPQTHNKDSKELKGSNANAPSPAPVVALPPVGASVGAAENLREPKEEHSLEDSLAGVGSLSVTADDLEDLLGGLVVPKK
ncbi:hypothetical protein KZX37_05585 [Microbacterium sp. EYE_5]|uniref:hypothetical protein n=1 Tax=unclassified Microbacterium TaxID=2609290 RepID=UPI002004CA82|nr:MULTISPECIES: hypothetical protein [unclassified Microbacterium]MCK6080092.1 hypothetical protein [Microbacterium sp. EYE_382]MCK6085363.1 hypothetical protein [Microbacterium sp. EYE_384]MCK6122412.1 hypothetical protein [Microbacterium sp. EYE_80]MCK6126126.1 hypothetical protein [Microbacterium sp. EYE_79]MCK6141047.1 hypothetical protein [Microbacterium sp. EYE_39]